MPMAPLIFATVDQRFQVEMPCLLQTIPKGSPSHVISSSHQHSAVLFVRSDFKVSALLASTLSSQRVRWAGRFLARPVPCQAGS